MHILDYYKSVYPQLEAAFSLSDYVLVNEKSLIEEYGADPRFPALTFNKEQLYYMTCERGFQVHLPAISSQAVLAPLDYELFLAREQKYLFVNRENHKNYFRKIWPVLQFIKDIFYLRKMPFILDYTASGGHILFYIPLYQESAKALWEIGALEDGLIRICNEARPGTLDYRVKDPVPLETARVFSGVTRIAEYIALFVMKEFRANMRAGKLPVMISDAAMNCINIDNSWCEGSPRFRSIRSPFSLHKKNWEKFKYKHDPLCDVIGMHFNGKEVTGINELDHVIDCMWDLGKAAEYAKSFTGHIPNCNNTLINFINEYKRSELYAFHKDFDETYDNDPGMALHYAKNITGLSDVTRWMLYWPNPMCLQPINLINFVKEFVIQHKWKPRHVANILRDVYADPKYNWNDDFYNEYPSDEKANFWARSYGALAYIEAGWMRI